jgi:hypothetical protein
MNSKTISTSSKTKPRKLFKKKKIVKEIKKTVQDMKEDLNKDIEILKRKKKRIK